MADSIARTFARWASNLTYEDLPPVVVDKIKSLILLHLTAAVIGAQLPRAKETVHAIKREEGKPDGATIIWDGGKATRIGATYAGAEMIHLTGLMDSYRMITHPGVSLIPAAMVNAELERADLKAMITALAAGYEVGCRLSYDFVPGTAARGFRPAPIYHTMGSAVVAAKLMGLDEQRMLGAIAIAANCASGLYETATEAVGGGETGMQDPNAARQGVFAAMTAREGHIRGSEQIIEGPFGFYNAFVGNNGGRPKYVFDGPEEIDLASVTAGLGSSYKLLELMYRMYNTGGYNHPVINLMVELRNQHKIDASAIKQVEVTLNWMESMRAPHVPMWPATPPRVGTTHYFVAHAAINGGFPQVGGHTFGPTEDPTKDEAVLAFMQDRVQIIGREDWPMFSPSITVLMNDGTRYSGHYPYARMQWNFDGLVEHLEDLKEKWPLGPAGLQALIDACRAADTLPSVEPLHALTRPS